MHAVWMIVGIQAALLGFAFLFGELCPGIAGFWKRNPEQQDWISHPTFPLTLLTRTNYHPTALFVGGKRDDPGGEWRENDYARWIPVGQAPENGE